jgi:predicted TIM-barrel fold metal-dependent hydrolase
MSGATLPLALPLQGTGAARRTMSRAALAGLAFVLLATLHVVASAQPPQRPMPPGMQQPGMPPGQAPQGPATVQAPAPWIDVHLHLVAGRGGQDDYGGAVDTAVREMDRFGIAMAIVMPPPQVDSQSPYDYPSYSGALRRYPGRLAFLAGGGTLNPTIHRYADPAKVTDKVKRDFAAAAEKLVDAGAVGFGEIAALHISAVAGHPYEFVPADHPLLLALADVAAKRGVPIDLHMDAVEGEAPAPQLMAGASNPPKLPDTMAALPRLLAHNPQAKIVWAHGGSDPIGAMSAATIGRLMAAHSNLYVSLRIHGVQAPTHNKVFADPGALDPAWKELLARHADRFMIGTDSFMVSPNVRGGGPGATFGERNEPKLRATVHFLSLLPADVAQKIRRDNAVKIYKLPVR